MDVPAPPPCLTLQVRTAYGAPPPRRIRLDLPGWAGSAERMEDGASPQPWHCRPFMDGATYGLELVYPYRNECRVHNAGGTVRFEGGLAEEMAAAGLPHPFGVFAAGHYGMATALDLLPPPGYALRLEPHPRVFTGAEDDVPMAVPGHLQRFWPRQFFAVFRAPAAGAVHAFRPGEPYAQLLLVPDAQTYDVQPMDAELAADRARQDRQVTTLGYFLARRLWRAGSGHWFDDKYKQLLRRFRRGGLDAVREQLQSVDDSVSRLAPPTPPDDR
ncbi:MAG: hypothetical protein JO180_01675 [Gemmatirosa sp.]|nr:hypothetical protein [Gemmatirosa sp.]